MRVSPDKVSPCQGARTSGTGITHAFGRFESSGRYHSKAYVFLYKKPMAGYLADRERGGSASRNGASAPDLAT